MNIIYITGYESMANIVDILTTNGYKIEVNQVEITVGGSSNVFIAYKITYKTDSETNTLK